MQSNAFTTTASSRETMFMQKKWICGGVGLVVLCWANMTVAATGHVPEQSAANAATNVPLEVKTVRQEETLKILLSLDRDNRGEKAQDDRVKQSFNLQSTEDSELLERCLGSGAVRIDYLDTVFLTLGTNSIPWLLSKYDGQSVHGRAYVLHALERLDSSDVFEFLLFQMDDKTEVPNAHAKAVAPPGYRPLRICDLAYNALTYKMTTADSGFQSLVKERYVNTLTPLAKREERIAELKAIITEHANEFSAFLDRLPRVIRDTKYRGR